MGELFSMIYFLVSQFFLQLFCRISARCQLVIVYLELVFKIFNLFLMFLLQLTKFRGSLHN